MGAPAPSSRRTTFILLSRTRQRHGVSALRPDAVAVRADHVALCGLREEDRRRAEHRPARRQSERLRGAFAVIKVHLMGREGRAAVQAGPLTQLAEELDSAVLPIPNARQLERPVSLVVRHVGRTLIALCHPASLERMDHLADVDLKLSSA